MEVSKMTNVTIINSYKSITNNDILNAESQMGKSFPEQYKNFLLRNNGGRPEFQKFSGLGEDDGFFGILSWFFGLHPDDPNDLIANIERFSDRIPNNMIPIASDPGGNLVVLSVEGKDKGKVYFWDHEEEADEGEIPTYDNLYLVANDFDDFLADLRENDF
jgi:SMI1-KNR4 cell-wall